MKIFKYTNVSKIRPVGAELFHVDGRTDMTKIIVALNAICQTRLKLQLVPHKEHSLFLLEKPTNE